MVHYDVHKSPPQVTVQSQTSCVHFVKFRIQRCLILEDVCIAVVLRADSPGKAAQRFAESIPES
jgi:hypothetical protein